MNPLISVVIPVRNREDLIVECLHSILNQSYPHFEVVIVDDSSTDKTINVIRQFDDNRIKLFTFSQKSGAQHARNFGVLQASGDWIAFQDSDDIWLLDKLEKQVQVLRQYQFSEALVVHGNAFLHDNCTGHEKRIFVPKTSGNDSFKLLLARPSPFFPCILTSKSALMEIGLLDENVPSYQEWDTAIRLSRKCFFVHLKDSLFKYVRHSEETISDSKFRDFLGYQYVIKKFEKEIIEVCGVSIFRQHLLRQLNKFFQHKIYNDCWKEYSYSACFFDDISEYCSQQLICLDDVQTKLLLKKAIKNIFNFR